MTWQLALLTFRASYSEVQLIVNEIFGPAKCAAGWLKRKLDVRWSRLPRTMSTSWKNELLRQKWRWGVFSSTSIKNKTKNKRPFQQHLTIIHWAVWMCIYEAADQTSHFKILLQSPFKVSGKRAAQWNDPFRRSLSLIIFFELADGFLRFLQVQTTKSFFFLYRLPLQQLFTPPGSLQSAAVLPRMSGKRKERQTPRLIILTSAGVSRLVIWNFNW